MGLPEFKTCCFCFDLKTGNIIMGALNVINSFSITVIMIVVASEISVEKDQVNKDFSKYTKGTVEFFEQLNLKTQIAGAYALTIILLVIFLLKTILDGAYVYAVVKGHQGIIKTYLIIWIVICILSLFTFFFNLSHQSGWNIAYFVLYWGFNVYAILLGRSYYKNLNYREDV